MERIILDDELRGKLLSLTRPLELCDETGKVVAQVWPVFDPAEYEELVPEINDEELERRANSEGPWYTTAEVLEHLKKLESQ